jgi:hypothetical protein
MEASIRSILFASVFGRNHIMFFLVEILIHSWPVPDAILSEHQLYVVKIPWWEGVAAKELPFDLAETRTFWSQH